MNRPCRALASGLVLVLSSVAAAACSSAPVVEQATVTDARELPPESRTFRSPSGAHELTVLTADRWQSPQARVVLRALSPSRTLWDTTLPQELGPRRAVVTDRGAVVLVDEWINVPSQYALMVLDVTGRRLATYSLDDLIRVLEVPRRAISDNATLGIWLSAEPALSADGLSVRFRTAGRGLILQLSDGQLTATN